MQPEKENKKIFTASNATTAILLIFIASMFIFPNFKATILQGLMKVGLFQPGVPSKHETSATEPSWDIICANSKSEIVDGNSLKGKVVFINFWATWCPPCIAEMPSINELYNTYKNNPDIIFLMVDADNDLLKSEGFMNKKSYNLPVYTSQSPIPTEWYEGSLPTTIVLDKKSNIVFQETGAADYTSKKFKTFIEDLLKN